MKVDLSSLLGAKRADAAARKGKAAPGFEALLRDTEGGKAPARQPASADEKKPRSITGTEEALLVARTLPPAARPAPLIVTKSQDLKGAAKAPAAVEARTAVTVEHLATRAKAVHEHQRVTAPTEKRATRTEAVRELPLEAPTRESKKLDEPTPPQLAAPQAAPQVNEPFHLEAPPPVQDARPLAPVAPLVLDDPSARVVLLPTVARMTLDTGDAGLLNVQLKVRDGVTELTAAGPAAPLLEARQGELRVALAREGLALGHFDLTQSGSQHRHAERPDPEALPTTRRPAATPSSPEHAPEDGRVHVKV